MLIRDKEFERILVILSSKILFSRSISKYLSKKVYYMKGNATFEHLVPLRLCLEVFILEGRLNTVRWLH